MYRNLNNRVECISPVYEPAHRKRLAQMLDLMLADRRQCWDMQPDGSYVQRQPGGGDPETAVGLHQTLMDPDASGPDQRR